MGTIADVVEARGLLPLVDFAYQGLAEGCARMRLAWSTLCRPGRELLIASSFSKNFGLYNERVGALTLVADSAAAAQAALSHIKTVHPGQLLQSAGPRLEDRHHDPEIARAARLNGRLKWPRCEIASGPCAGVSWPG